MTEPLSSVPDGVPTCYRHPAREAYIRCQRCEKSICPDCMRDAAVGFQCPDCIKEASKGSRQNRALYGGQRSADPRLTSYVLIGLNLLVWAAILATGARASRLTDLLALRPGGRCDLNDGYVYDVPEAACRGGTFLPGVGDGAWWQVVTSAFTHVELWHIAGNLLAIYILGPALEGVIGRTRFVAVYLAGALGGSVAVLWLANPLSSTVGASGAIFGLLGALLVTATKARVDRQWIVQNLMLGVLITVIGWRFISWQGHLGGLLGGAAAAAIIAFAPRTRRSLVQWVGLALLAVVLLALALLRASTLA